MKEYNYYLFDLDGTLTDPKVGITKSVQYALKKKGIIIDDLTELEKFIGPPLHQSFSKYYGFDAHEAMECVELYREYFKDRGITENTIYPFIADLLSFLKETHKKVILATSKPTVYARQILEHFDIIDFFDQVVGSNLDLTRSDKTEIIAYIIVLMELSDKKDDMIMFGDRSHDLVGAINNGVDTAGVLYGYGSQDELQDCNPQYIFKDPQELFLQIRESINTVKKV